VVGRAERESQAAVPDAVGPQAAPVAAEDEMHARLREAEEEAAQAQAELARLLRAAQAEAEPNVEDERMERAESRECQEVLPEVRVDEAEHELKGGVADAPFATAVSGERTGEGQGQVAMNAMGAVNAVDEANAPPPAGSPEAALASKEETAAAAQDRLDEEAYERRRAENERAREAQVEGEIARLLARDGKAADDPLVKGGPAVLRAARAAAQKLARAAALRRQRPVEPPPKPTPEPEMKLSLIEHLQRVKRQEQDEELRGGRGARHVGRIAPGVIVGTGGVRPPGYNPPWDRNDRPRYAEGSEFEWST
jgi:hypothetical protein